MSRSIRRTLSASGLISTVYKQFEKIPDPRKFNTSSFIPLKEHLMSGLAIFGLKFPSLLQYDRERKKPPIEENLKNLYHVNTPPSDTYLRERLDRVDPKIFRSVFKQLFAKLQRGKCLESFEYFEGHYLLSIDGTGEFSSSKVSCKHCCKKEHRSGQVTYYHQMLGGCIVHPDQSNVIPLCPEIIQNIDGNEKNDCERNAAKRFIENFRREHPHLKVIAIQDGLASNAPYIEFLEEKKIKYIFGAKPGDHAYLFQQLEKSSESKYFELREENGTLHQFRFTNGLSLNKSHLGLKVNIIEYRETRTNGKELNFSWVTNISVTENNVYQLMRGGRARWKIENETFNTLKNLGYNFEHNYGHGKEFLASVFCTLMILSFFIDQIQEISCHLFQLAREEAGTYRTLWQRMRTFFEYFVMPSWEEFYQLIARQQSPNTS